MERNNHTLQRAEAVMSSPGGKLFGQIYLLLVSALMSTLLALILVNVSSANRRAESAQDHNNAQDIVLTTINNKQSVLSKNQDTLTRNQQVLIHDVTRNSDDIEYLKAAVPKAHP